MIVINKTLRVIIFSCFAIFYSNISIAAYTRKISAELIKRDEFTSNKLSVTYVGNAGFLISIGDKKILIDALFKGFEGSYELPQEVQDKLTLAQAPFDDVDLILVTHAHGDHINPEMVRQHMKNNPEAIFASTQQTVDLLNDFPDRCFAFNPAKGESEEKEINGIGVEAFYLPHGPDSRVINIGFLISVSGVTLFQTGDIDFDQFAFNEFRALQLPEKNIDISFIQHFYLTNDSLSKKFVQEAIGGRYIIPIHYHFTTPAFDSTIIRLNYPDAIIFREELETWDMPSGVNDLSLLEGDYQVQAPCIDNSELQKLFDADQADRMTPGMVNACLNQGIRKTQLWPLKSHWN